MSLSDTYENVITSLNLEYLEQRLVDTLQWSLETAQEAIRRYKNFLTLHIKYPHQNLVPTADIDEVWHNHILFTREYFWDCDRCFGHYLHHAPAKHSGPEEDRSMKNHYFTTEMLYIEEFNEPYFSDSLVPEFLWDI